MHCEITITDYMRKIRIWTRILTRIAKVVERQATDLEQWMAGITGRSLINKYHGHKMT